MEVNKNLLVVLGSPRVNGNSEIIANQISDGFAKSDFKTNTVRVENLNILPCTGCLKCNKTGKCETHKDGWDNFLTMFKKATHIVMASPIYFHHLPGTFKIVLDRFRSQIQIQMTATGLVHNPIWKERKKYAFVFSLGDRKEHDTIPAKNILTFWAKLFGAKNEDIQVLAGYGLAIRRQVSLSKERLQNLYGKLGIPVELAEKDYEKNQALLKNAFGLGQKWGTEKSSLI